MEGYGRSDKTRDINCDIANGADDLAAATDYILKRARRRAASWRTASRRARCAPRCSRSAIRSASRGSRSTRSSGPAKARPTLEQRRKKLPRVPGDATAGRSTARSCQSIFERDHPDCAETRVVDAFADAILALDDSMPTGTYVDMCSKLPVVDPAKITMPTLDHARRSTTASRASTT